jgi:hypothetical protein
LRLVKGSAPGQVFEKLIFSNLPFTTCKSVELKNMAVSTKVDDFHLIQYDDGHYNPDEEGSEAPSQQ